MLADQTSFVIYIQAVCMISVLLQGVEVVYSNHQPLAFKIGVAAGAGISNAHPDTYRTCGNVTIPKQRYIGFGVPHEAVKGG